MKDSYRQYLIRGRVFRVLAMAAALATLFMLWSVAGAQSVGDPPPAAPSAAVVNGLIDTLLTVLGGALVRPVTAIFQTWHVTAKVDAKTIAAVLAIGFVGIQGYANGVYGQGLQAVLYAALASGVAFANSYGRNRAATISANRGAVAAISSTPEN